jgi:hypothetical protein
MEQSYRPAKDVKDAVLVWSGTTTALGDTLNLTDNGLTQGANYWINMAVLIRSGNSNGQIRRISAFAAGTITVDTAFASVITLGTKYDILGQHATTGGGGDATLANQLLILGDIGDASTSTLLSLYGIIGNPSASLSTTILDGIDARTNNATLNALLGVTDAAGRSINGNIGDFQAQTNLQTLLASLGIPDVAAKPLYTCLVTDRLDNGTYGLSALNTDLDTIITDTEKIYDVTLGVAPADGSLASFIATGGTALGTRLPVNKSLYDVIGAATGSTLGSIYAILGNPAQNFNTMVGYEGASSLASKLTAARAGYLDNINNANLSTIANISTLTATNIGYLANINQAGLLQVTATRAGYLDNIAATAAGRTQVIEVSITSDANAGDVTVATVTTQPCIIDSIIIHADAAQTANMTTCAVTGGASKVITFISTADATQANLNAADKQVSWVADGLGAVRLAATKTIVISLLGTPGVNVDLTISITYHAAVSGGYLT